MEKSEQDVRELRAPGFVFPADCTAYDASQTLEPNGQYKFGASKERSVALIRELADRIESGKYLLQGVESNHKVVLADYTISSFTFSFAEKAGKRNAANQES